MKRKSRKNFNQSKKAITDLTEKFFNASPPVQRKVLWLITELIKNLTDEDLKNFWTEYREILITNSEIEPITDLEEMTRLREAFSDYFAAVEKHQSETVSALEEVAKKDTSDLEAMLESDV